MTAGEIVGGEASPPITAVEGLAGLERLRLAERPTTLQDAPALRRALGVDLRLLVKRDDLFGPGVGGNKVRKLEYAIAEALRQGCDTLVTSGAVQSNHARLTAVCGAMCGLQTHLVLDGDPREKPGGNLVLDGLASASLHFVRAKTWDVLMAAADDVADRLRRQGRRPFVIPVGASMPSGAVGYADAYVELVGQLEETGLRADAIVHASGSGGTQAGLLAGRTFLGRGPAVVGVDVAKGGTGLVSTILEVAEGCCRLLGAAPGPEPADVVLFDGAGPGYGVVTADGARALRVAFRSSGLLFDPVYTAKALAALSRLVDDGTLRPGATVVFLHTGGSPAVFSPTYADQLGAWT